jgi:hypothetical protein
VKLTDNDTEDGPAELRWTIHKSDDKGKANEQLSWAFKLHKRNGNFTAQVAIWDSERDLFIGDILKVPAS